MLFMFSFSLFFGVSQLRHLWYHCNIKFQGTGQMAPYKEKKKTEKPKCSAHTFAFFVVKQTSDDSHKDSIYCI